MARLNRFFLAFLTAATLAVTGCNAPLAPTTATAVTKDVGARPFVFGTVKVLSPKAPPAWTETDCSTDIFYWHCPDGFRLTFLRPGDPTPIVYRLTGDGSFKVPLDPGDYFLAEWDWHQADMSSVNEKIGGAIRATFRIGPGVKATYIGDLQIVFSGSRYAFKLDDRFEQASASLTTEYPQLASNVAKSLLEMKTPPGGARQVPICDPSWGTHCDDRIAGVDPVQPAQSGSGFPTVATLTPTLEWKKVGGDDITYDVAIYEALPYGPPLRRSYVQGPMVEFAQGLTAPSYAVKTSLKPRAEYFWTVRLRRGETTSDWSSMSYREFAFLIVAFVSGHASNIPFRFATP